LNGGGLRNCEAARAAMQRRGDALFPPLVVSVWMTDDGQRVDPSLVDSVLSLPYVREATGSPYVDTNLNSERLHRLMQQMPDRFLGWSERCSRLRQRALEILQQDVELSNKKATAIRNAKRQSEIRLAQFAARFRSVTGIEAITEQDHLELETRLSQALLNGILTPLIRLDVLGFVMVSGEPYPQ
jgi:ATP-dependent helicase HepA